MTDLGFWYCDNCKDLDEHDLAYNVTLLMLLADYAVEDFITWCGFT